MRFLLAALLATGLAPLILAWRAHRATSLAHALLWALIAWLGWILAIVLEPDERTGIDPWRYCALCLTGCAGIAVLGARRPHVFAWNFVVLGLFAVMVLPLLETMIIRTHPVSTLRIFFMSATIAVGILNYLPTRFGPAALLLAFVCAGEIMLLYAPTWLPGDLTPYIADGLLAATPWVAWSCGRKPHADDGATTLWLEFRDAWGLFWGQRVREQFNRAAENTGWALTLTWRGMRRLDGGADVQEEKVVEVLRAILQRFL